MKLLSGGQSRCAETAPASRKANVSSGTPAQLGSVVLDSPQGATPASSGRLPSQYTVRAATAAVASKSRNVTRKEPSTLSGQRRASDTRVIISAYLFRKIER
jgi:hypothetical protein